MELAERARGEHAKQKDADTRGDNVIRSMYVEVSHLGDQQVAITKFANPQITFTVEDERPFPGGLAKGLWKGRPITPLTKCGTALARKAPPKK